MTDRYTELRGIGVESPAGSIGDETVWHPVEVTHVKVKVTLPSTLDGPIVRETSMYPEKETTPFSYLSHQPQGGATMTIKVRKSELEHTLRGWRGNKIDQEEQLEDSDILDTFWECGAECYKIRENRPLLMQIATHIAICMNYSFEAEDFGRFEKRNWDFLLDAMEHRNDTLGE